MTTEADRFATPRVAAGVLFRDTAGRVLLVNPTYKDGWEIPGGYVETGESPRAAAAREVREELGIDVNLSTMIVVDWAPHPAEGDKLLLLFDGGLLDQTDIDGLVIAKEELSAAQFFDVDRLHDLLPARLARRVVYAATGEQGPYLEHGAAADSERRSSHEEGLNSIGTSRPASEEAFLLGAGASAEAGLPVSRELTKELLSSFADDGVSGREAAALNFVVAAIVHHDSRHGERPDNLPDIERVASSIELLAGRTNLEIAPFVNSWDPTVEALETRRPDSPAFIERDLMQSLIGRGSRWANSGTEFDPDWRKLVNALEKLIDRRTAGGRNQLFQALLQELVVRLAELLQVRSADSFDYLKPIADMAMSRPRNTSTLVATLNYDLGFETMAGRASCPVDRSVESWVSSQASNGSDSSDSGTGINLLKLHGSLDWQKVDPVYGELPVSGLTIDGTAPAYSRAMPFLVFGQREKLRAEGPFLELLEAFRRRLSHVRHLTVIGYGFRDAHINEVIGRWYNSDSSRRITIIDPFFPDGSEFPPLEGFQGALLEQSYAQAPQGGDQEAQRAALDQPRVNILRQPASSYLRSLQNAD